MNSSQRLARRLVGATVDRPPNLDIMMTFAARYIGQPLSAYYQDYRVLVEANLTVCTDFDLDILQVISDPYREASDLGLEVFFPQDDLPVNTHPLLTNPGERLPLKMIHPEDGRRMSDRLAAIQELTCQSHGEIPVMGWVEGSLAEAADLRGVGALLADLYDHPGWVQDLLDFCCEVGIAFAQAQVKAGATIIGLGDALASQVSARMYRQFALPYEQRIFQAVHEMGALARLHICGNTSHLLESMVETGADIIDLDWMVDLYSAARIFGNQAAPCGNFDPVAILLKGTPAQVYASTMNCLQNGGVTVLSAAGCEVPLRTPPENLHAQSRALHDWREEAG
ncbi:MAG TPA: uroporphyrinogen decarboxylase family protein [Anaerolineaceae bacterium]